MKAILFSFLFLVFGNSWATSTWLYDDTKDAIITCNECNKIRPIASITKLMTAIVALEHNSNLSLPIKIGRGSRIPPGMTTRGDLFSAMLVTSDNRASEILSDQYPGGRKGFIKAMNNKAKELGMDTARFVDPSGLSSKNIATVSDVSILIRIAAMQPIIADMSILQEVEVSSKNASAILDNTNKTLLENFPYIITSKTGHTRAAGWNMAVVLEYKEQRFVVVVLGAKTKEQRNDLVKNLIEKHLRDIEIDVAQTKKRQYNNSVIINWILELFGYGQK